MTMRLFCSKFEEVAQFLMPQTRSLLDVGCRDGRLKGYLPPAVEYTGIDLTLGPCVTQVCDIEQGIPYPDKSFDTVVALDVLEHTDNIWFVFSELVRVAKLQIMVVLPNCYHWNERLRFLRGKERDKHKLSPQPIKDRHRWLPSYRTAHAFSTQMALKFGLTVTESMMVDDRPNLLRELAARVLPRNVMCVAIFFLYTKLQPDLMSPKPY